MSMIQTKTIKGDGDCPNTIEVVMPFNDTENDAIVRDKTLLFNIDISTYLAWKRAFEYLKSCSFTERSEFSDAFGNLVYVLDANVDEVAAFMKEEDNVVYDAQQKFGDFQEEVVFRGFRSVTTISGLVTLEGTYAHVEGKAETTSIHLSELAEMFEPYIEKHMTPKKEPLVSREDFMAFWRSDEMAEVLTADDRLEIFHSAPIGAGDITKAALEELMGEYGVENLSVIDSDIEEDLSMTFTVSCHETKETKKVRVSESPNGLGIHPEGYATIHGGAPITLDYFNAKDEEHAEFNVLVWGDIHQEDFTDKIPLSGAKDEGWIKFEEFGAYYKVVDGVLYHSAMLINGAKDADVSEVETCIESKDKQFLEKINIEFETSFEYSDFK